MFSSVNADFLPFQYNIGMSVNPASYNICSKYGANVYLSVFMNKARWLKSDSQPIWHLNQNPLDFTTFPVYTQ